MHHGGSSTDQASLGQPEQNYPVTAHMVDQVTQIRRCAAKLSEKLGREPNDDERRKN